MGYEDSTRINIIDVARELGFNPVPIAKNIYMDKTHDSLRFWSDTNSFCWYSKSNEINVKGSSFNLVQFVKKISFPEAKNFLIRKGLYTADNKNINENFRNKNRKISTYKNENQITFVEKNEKEKLQVPPFNNDLTKMINYFKEIRKIEPSTIWKLIKNHKIIAFDKLENICFFAKNKEGEWKNITKRRIDKKEFYACKGGDKNYPFFINNKAKDYLIVEGEIDAISAYEMYGNKLNYISIPATTNKGLIHHILENNIKNCSMYLMLDNDNSGAEATKILIKDLEKLNRNFNITDMSKILLENVKDPNELLIKKKQNDIKIEKKKNKNYEIKL